MTLNFSTPGITSYRLAFLPEFTSHSCSFSSPGGWRLISLEVLLLLKRNRFYASGCPIRTCRDRRYRRGSSLATPPCSVVRHTCRDVQNCRLRWLPPGLLGADDWAHTPLRLLGVCGEQRPRFIPVESLDCGSRGKNKTMSRVCTEQLHCRQTADVGIVHPPKDLQESGESCDIGRVRGKGDILEPSSLSVRAQGGPGKFREAPRFQRCSLRRNTFENLKLLTPKRSNSVIFFNLQTLL